ncbi:hypothetical protein GCM10023116_21640 [Kistimonas scapharcae]|uniref:Uncharacterized protein n=1 Tax=Kistimonas scapharcae TaxID=1036133 RepID=A0ABP8V369_9GAMM
MNKIITLISVLFLLLHNHSVSAEPVSTENNENIQSTSLSELLIRFVSGAEFNATIYYGDVSDSVENLKRVWTFYERQHQFWLPVGTRVLIITYASLPTGWELLAALMTGDLDIPEEAVCHYFTVQAAGFSTVDYRGTYTYPVFHISDPTVFKPLFNSEDNHVTTSGICHWPDPVYENFATQE